ncbi:MAG: carboxylesterase family protein, partial [Salegentibacter sp.]
MKFISSRTSAFLLILLIAPMAALPQQKQPVQTRIENGLIEGYQDSGENLDIYLGIPFAQPPVEELRWKAPQPAKDWKGVRETKKFGPAAVQTNVFGDMIYRGDGKSEDCLYLNVWTPSGNKTENLPVLVYFYGGGFVAGDGSEPRYDGAAMAQRGMVTVTVNYRLNIFGFFAHPGLTAESPNNASGNYGLLDQNMALKWVQKNIAAFGGDPGRVTIAGESAGSISVSEQMASPLSKDLFAGAIGESGAAIKPTLAPVPLKKAEEIGVKFAENAGYSLEELRKLSTDELFKLYNDSGLFGFPSVIDGYFLPKPLPEIFRAGEQAQVPLLVGWNSA